MTPVIQLLGRIGPLAVGTVPQLQKIAFEQDGALKQAAEQALLLLAREIFRQVAEAFGRPLHPSISAWLDAGSYRLRVEITDLGNGKKTSRTTEFRIK